MNTQIEAIFRSVQPDVDFCSLRLVHSRAEQLEVRQGVLQPIQREDDRGAMLTVHHQGGTGYAATADLSEAGLRDALGRAAYWAAKTAGRAVTDFSALPMPEPVGVYSSDVGRAWDSVPLADRLDLLRSVSDSIQVSDKIVDSSASLWNTEDHTLYLTSGGGRVEQKLTFLVPHIEVVANDGGDTQIRTLGGRGFCRQSGWEMLAGIGFSGVGPELAEEALQLLAAPDCPSDVMDLVLDPDQMILQIHESIGHPLELDRILGDERNYAGTSFVTLDMFGSYRYGSDLLNVTYDPTCAEQFASYGFDDEGLPATREYIIRAGMLERPLGGAVSQARATMPGVANSRANGWNRPPIDRMANLNVEPGETSGADLIAGVERGVLMKANRSWSIDDSRNKFQFGCEWGQLIEDGELTSVVKNPNYRGVSATFWRNLSAVGDADTNSVLGTPFCGKGEPNQVIRVGHASPLCRFSNVDIFGGQG
jgi:predicted Zn-dependent protease